MAAPATTPMQATAIPTIPPGPTSWAGMAALSVLVGDTDDETDDETLESDDDEPLESDALAEEEMVTITVASDPDVLEASERIEEAPPVTLETRQGQGKTQYEL